MRKQWRARSPVRSNYDRKQVLCKTYDNIGLFQRYAQDPRCQRILFAASGSTKYVRLLETHRSSAEKITIVQRGDADTSLVYLGFEGVIFPEVFDSLDEMDATENAAVYVSKKLPRVRVLETVRLYPSLGEQRR